MNRGSYGRGVLWRLASSMSLWWRKTGATSLRGTPVYKRPWLPRPCAAYHVSTTTSIMHKLTTARDDDDMRSRGVQIFPDFITPAEETTLYEYFHKQLRKRKYERDHWDGVIEAYRELQRTIAAMPEEAQHIVERCREAAFRPGAVVQPQVHILDLAPDGYIDFHVDSVKFSGDHVVGLCLLSDAVMRLRHEQTSETVDLFLPRRSLYCLRDEARYEFAHAILRNEEATFEDKPIARDRRITMMLRDEVVTQ
eukprot:gb/GECG01003744.1/.p1 GENE.gb/GECG01003744.1/~~gb/GECG01003744.1/.p1  ORF type:complete len:252 (+),score=21.30 gb/GECG01003744.1/:1-756(+)